MAFLGITLRYNILCNLYYDHGPCRTIFSVCLSLILALLYLHARKFFNIIYFTWSDEKYGGFHVSFVKKNAFMHVLTVQFKIKSF